jgi:hypothetical protein
MLPVIWVTCAVVIIAAAVRAGRNPRAARIGRWAVALLFLGAGALVNAIFLATGDDYAEFADGAYLRFVSDTWRELVVPNHHLFISLLIAFETIVGLLVLAGGRRAELGFEAAIVFHVALLSFGWGFYLWSIPMIAAFSLHLRAARHPSGMAVTAVIHHAEVA